MRKRWMCFRLDHGTILHPQNKFQPWPAKVQIVSDAEFMTKKEAENFILHENLGKGFYFVHEVWISE